MSRSLSEIAAEIRADWKVPYLGAVPYIAAMSNLQGINDRYMTETGRDQVVRFLCNASTWRGDVARRIKAELNVMLGKQKG